MAVSALDGAVGVGGVLHPAVADDAMVRAGQAHPAPALGKHEEALDHDVLPVLQVHTERTVAGRAALEDRRLRGLGAVGDGGGVLAGSGRGDRSRVLTGEHDQRITRTEGGIGMLQSRPGTVRCRGRCRHRLDKIPVAGDAELARRGSSNNEDCSTMSRTGTLRTHGVGGLTGVCFRHPPRSHLQASAGRRLRYHLKSAAKSPPSPCLSF